MAGDIPKFELMIVEHINRFVCVNMKGQEMKRFMDSFEVHVCNIFILTYGPP